MSAIEKQVWEDIVLANAMGLASLAVPGELITPAPPPRFLRYPPIPSPFAEVSYCSCGEREINIAQFWHASRLWRICFCSNTQDCQRVDISSVHSTDSLPEGSVIQGNSSWSRTPAQFLHEPGSKAWDTHEAVRAMAPMFGKRGEGEDDFYQASCRTLNAQCNSTHSRLGGAPTFIQWPHEPQCPHCRLDLSLVCQLGPDTCFHWGDLGQMYVFYCPSHPKQVRVYIDTH